MAMNIRTDEEIQADALEELKWNTRVQTNEIEVAVKDGSVTLTGWVDSYLKKIAAEEVTYHLPGVKAVVNDIEVRLPDSAERSDVDIAAAVLNALRWDAAIPAGTLDVMVNQGWVTLKGEVDHGFQKRAALRVTCRLSGVKGITNLIMVKPHVLPSDLKHQIKRALIRNAETDARNITVEVEDSRVILRGAVRSYAEKHAAEEAVCWSAPGVTEVDNQIVILPLLS